MCVCVGVCLRACVRVRVCVFSLQQTYESKRQEFLGDLQGREEEMRQMFVLRVKEKEAELKDAEREVRIPTSSSKNAPRNKYAHVTTLTESLCCPLLFVFVCILAPGQV